jgi:hypothetical protein
MRLNAPPVRKLSIQYGLWGGLRLDAGADTRRGWFARTLRGAATPSGTPPLVYSRISQRNSSATAAAFLRSAPGREFCIKFEVFRHDLRVKRIRRGLPPPAGGGFRGEIDSFSDASRRRLKHVASDARTDLISQFLLTYHQLSPDAETIKTHLNAWLTWLRNNLPDSLEKFKYLWILEFQNSGMPHFHVYMNIPSQPGSEFHLKMARAWSRITSEGVGTSHTRFHAHKKNWIAWNMGTGSYLCKYLEKTAQKKVPDGFGMTGRFWGCSRGLMRPPGVYSAYDMSDMCTDDLHGRGKNVSRETHRKNITATILRTLARYQQSVRRRYGYHGKPLTQHITSSWVTGGAAVFHKQLEFMIRSASIPVNGSG